MNLDLALQTFLDESRELLADMERILLELESQPDESELQNALFRCVHTVKGSAGMFGLDHVVEFTHVVENVLDRLRSDEIQLTRTLADLLLRCRDHISLLVEISEPREADALEAGGNALLAGLAPFQSLVAAGDAAEVVAGSADVVEERWHLAIAIDPEALRHGMDPLGFIRFLATLGKLNSVTTTSDGLPDLDAFDPEACYLGFDMELETSAIRVDIEGVFELAGDLYRVQLSRPGAPADDQGNAAETIAGTSTAAVVEPSAAVDDGVDVSRGRRRKPVQHIRIQADKLDKLINLVGELVISSAAVSLDAHRSGDADARETAASLNLLVEEIRDSSLDLRMVPIGDTFQRFQRVVRDVSAELGKDIELIITGAETELDKTVVEKIGDPLTHLVRNACDHGIEAPAMRRDKGKPARGRVHLNAYHESGAIIVEVSDDGSGLDRERILAKAIEREVISADAVLSDQEVFRLIFEPGFSTVDQVTNLSGRGVGMDVVRRNIEGLRGMVELVTPGVAGGTTFRIRLPLTLAIIDGFLARVGDATYVVPLEMVAECTELDAEQQKLSEDRNYINLRQEVLPLIRLRDHFEVSGAASRRQNVIVVRQGEQRAGLIVDELLGEHQTVIKPLSGIFAHLRGLTGSTILGSGQVALILDVPALMQQVAHYEDVANRGIHHNARPRLSASYL